MECCSGVLSGTWASSPGWEDGTCPCSGNGWTDGCTTVCVKGTPGAQKIPQPNMSTVHTAGPALSDSSDSDSMDADPPCSAKDLAHLIKVSPPNYSYLPCLLT